MRSIVLATLLLSLAACQNSGEALSRGQFHRQQQFTRDFETAFRANDHHKLALLYADDAILLPPNLPQVRGREAIREYFTNMPVIQDAALRTIEAIHLDDQVFVRGEYTMTMELGGESVEDRGKYIELRQRGKDGVWRITRDMYSSDLPPMDHH